jgi:TRAP-type C4-dicarboxylate transport system permease small subunit
VTVNETNTSRCGRTDTEGAASAAPSLPPEGHPPRGFGSIAGLTRFLERTSAWLAGALLVINVGDILLGVLFRYVFKSSVIWTEEVARFSLVWLVLLGAPGALYRGDHMAIEFLLPRFPRWARLPLGLFRLGVTVFVLGLLIWFGAQNVAGTWTMRTMALNIPKAIPLSAVPLGMGMLLLLSLLLAVERGLVPSPSLPEKTNIPSDADPPGNASEEHGAPTSPGE